MLDHLYVISFFVTSMCNLLNEPLHLAQREHLAGFSFQKEAQKSIDRGQEIFEHFLNE